MTITPKQWFQIVQGTIGGLVTGAALMQTLLGQDLTIKIVAGLGLLNILVTSIATPLSGADSQETQVKNVLAMPGVEKLDVNAKASPDLAKMAVDQNIDKIGPTAAAAQQVEAIAKAAS